MNYEKLLIIHLMGSKLLWEVIERLMPLSIIERITTSHNNERSNVIFKPVEQIIHLLLIVIRMINNSN